MSSEIWRTRPGDSESDHDSGYTQNSYQNNSTYSNSNGQNYQSSINRSTLKRNNYSINSVNSELSWERQSLNNNTQRYNHNSNRPKRGENKI